MLAGTSLAAGTFTMLRFIPGLIVILVFFSGCSKPPESKPPESKPSASKPIESNHVILTPTEFTKEFAETLQQSSPETKVEIRGELELRVVKPGGQESTSFLDNAYQEYKLAVVNKTEIIQKYVAATLEITTQTTINLIRYELFPS